MHLILLSGGSGKRLWPLSNGVRSKQFLKLLTDEHGRRESMVQRVFRQIRQAIPDAEITLATNAAQVDNIRSQIGGGADIVLEPERRDTFPAILLASAHLAFHRDVSSDETVIVLPVDPYTETGFFRSFGRLSAALGEGADIALMGISPLLPTSKYGYILPGEETAPGIFCVTRFVEKPDEDTAAGLIGEGALWNAGVFAFKLGYLTDICEKAGFHTYEQLLGGYASLKKISFDYEVVEQAKRVAAVLYRGRWTDIGTWRTLTDEMDAETLGNVVAEDTKNTYVVNDLSIPVVVLGTKDLIVAASPDGILVSDLVSSSRLKPIADKIDSRPMFEERRWGEYTAFDAVGYADGQKSLVKHLFLLSGRSISYQSHRCRDEVFVITSGEADAVIDGAVRRVTAGDTLSIKAYQKHAVRARTDLHIIEVQMGSRLLEDDIEKFSFDWEDIR